ncbi:MAG: ABC transporter permease [Thermoleophilaceae bacterium]
MRAASNPPAPTGGATPRWVARARPERYINVLGLPLVIVLLCLYFGTQSDNFFTESNFQNIGRNIAALALLALAEAVVIVIGQIDLSVGAALGLISVIVVLAVDQFGPAAGFVAAPVAGLAIGLVNGLLVTWLRVHAVIVTIGSLTAISGLALVITNGTPVTADLPKAMTWLGDGQVASVPVPMIVAATAFAAMAFVFRLTVFGPKLYATGGNEEAARLAGIDTRRVQIAAFCIAGLLAGVAALLLTGRIRSGQPTLGAGLELEAVAAAVVGGMALTGGRGTIGGVALGVALLTVLQNGLDITNVSSYWQEVVIGLVIFFALATDYVRRSRPATRSAGGGGAPPPSAAPAPAAGAP